VCAWAVAGFTTERPCSILAILYQLRNSSDSLTRLVAAAAAAAGGSNVLPKEVRVTRFKQLLLEGGVNAFSLYAKVKAKVEKDERCVRCAMAACVVWLHACMYGCMHSMAVCAVLWLCTCIVWLCAYLAVWLRACMIACMYGCVHCMAACIVWLRACMATHALRTWHLPNTSKYACAGSAVKLPDTTTVCAASFQGSSPVQCLFPIVVADLSLLSDTCLQCAMVCHAVTRCDAGGSCCRVRARGGPYLTSCARM
jgi:hypothetical protein